LVLLLDAKDKNEQLAKNLTDLKRKCVDAGKKIKGDKIRDIEFTTLIANSDDLGKTLKGAFPKGKDSKDDAEDEDDDDKDADVKQTPSRIEITFGQSDSLLLVGTSLNDLEKILVRQAGGTIPSLADEGVYDANHSA